MITISVKNLARFFGVRKIFENIEFDLKTGESIAITGPNGSGKTTLLRTLLGLLVPSKGSVEYKNGDKPLEFNDYRKEISIVAPYLILYDTMTGTENLRFLTKIDGRNISDEEIELSLERVGLGGRGGDMVGEYSTGMKQRLKYALAILRKPTIWMFDEPTANLDTDGKKIVINIINECKQDGLVIIATNEQEEYALADRLCQLGN